MVERLLHVLWVQTIVLSAAVAIVAALRKSVGRRFGAEASYLAWTLPPLAMLAAALPHRAQEVALLPPAIARLVPTWSEATSEAASGHGLTSTTILLATWAFVAVAMAFAIAWRQRRFLSQLSRGGTLPAGSGPAVLGILRPRIVLPVDFEQRFDPIERGLMLAHERVHQRRRDNAWNLVACAIVVVHWFNPLAWLAWRWMRLDQELSCDAAVLRDARPDTDPHPVRAYTAALLKVQGISLRPPLATTWQSTHPFVERVRMLNLHALSAASRRSGRRVVAMAIVLTGAIAYASQPSSTAPGDFSATIVDGSVQTKVTGQFDGRPPTRVTLTGSTIDFQPGQPALFTVSGGVDGSTIRFQPDPATGLNNAVRVRLRAKALDGERVMIALEITDDVTSAVIGKPTVITRMNEPARVAVTSADGAHIYSMTFESKPSATEGVR